MCFKITLHLKDTALLEGLYGYLSKYFKNISFNKYNSRTNKGIYSHWPLPQPTRAGAKQTVSLNISNIQDIVNIIIFVFCFLIYIQF